MREWQQNKDKLAVCETDQRKRKYIEGGGRKPKYTDLEDEPLPWINEKREQSLWVSRKIIMAKVKGLYDEKYKIDDTVNADEEFKVSHGWLEKFFARNGLCLRRKTTEAQKDPLHLVNKLVSYVLQIRCLKRTLNYADANIIAMDETAVWKDSCYLPQQWTKLVAKPYQLKQQAMRKRK